MIDLDYFDEAIEEQTTIDHAKLEDLVDYVRASEMSKGFYDRIKDYCGHHYCCDACLFDSDNGCLAADNHYLTPSAMEWRRGA